MKLHSLKATDGSRPNKHRVGRGHAAGKGKQAGRGQSGQNKRSGGGTRPGFEGGQNPFYRRIPKRGFNNINHINYQIVSLKDLETKFSTGDKIDFNQLMEQRLINRKTLPVKLLANGKITKKIEIKVHAASAKAIEAVEKAGGKVEVI